MIIKFERVSLAHKDRIMAFTAASSYRNCDYSFANLYNWGGYYDTQVAFHKGMMIIRFLSSDGRPACLMPVGDGDFEGVLADLNADFKEMGYMLTFMAVTAEGIEALNESYCGNIHVLANENYTDYIYEREKLVSLSGKKLQSKRNHINRFKATYPDYKYEVISTSNVEDCIALEERWYCNSERTDDIKAERDMVVKALREHAEIGMLGGCIRVDGQVIAFSMGMPINKDTFGVHIEKADTAFDGAFTIINQEFAAHIPEQYTYVNREEDLGLEGFRQAKLSYRPAILLEKKIVLLRCEQSQ